MKRSNGEKEIRKGKRMNFKARRRKVKEDRRRKRVEVISKGNQMKIRV